MEQLSYKTLKEENYCGFLLENAPERVVQFGEGNFLRAFADYWFDLLNEHGGFNGKVVLVTPRGHQGKHSTADRINAQDGLYTLYLRGQENGEKTEQKRIISSVSCCINPKEDFQAFLARARNPSIEFVVSNTTEAGIVYDPESTFEQEPPASFPGKLVRFLYERWESHLPGVTFLPCELIDDNGMVLREIVLRHAEEWGLEKDFLRWIAEKNTFCSTLVDCIVPGYPGKDASALSQENKYEDALMVMREVFGQWIIEGPEDLTRRLPIEAAGLSDKIRIVSDCRPYKLRKVRILNGAHTAFVPGAFLAGKDIVRDCMQDDTIRTFVETCIYKEIIPTIDMPREELESFASSVVDRFSNPFMDHRLLDICLNCTSKWKTRVLPSVKEYVRRFNRLPCCLTASFAMYLAFYRGIEYTENAYFGRRSGERYSVNDDRSVLQFFFAHRNEDLDTYVRCICARKDFWGDDLNLIDGFTERVTKYLTVAENRGSRALMDFVS